MSNRFGSWGVCFTYGSFFAVKGLFASGRTYDNSSSIRKACDFLLSKQQPTGGWGETYLSSENQVTVIFNNVTIQKICLFYVWFMYLLSFFLRNLLKRSPGTAVKLLPCNHEVMGSSPENSLLYKCREKLCA
jgi:hypothetical protein